MLNNNQITFCQEYVKNGENGTKAYLSVYKNCKKEEAAMAGASRLLRNVKVKEYIAELQSELKDETIMTAKERMKWLTDVIKDIETEEVTIKPNDGGKEFVIGKKTADLVTKMKAIDILNKMSGEYTTKFGGNIDGQISIRVELDE